jgi:predicted  nucleic acid-binding Zn-ribbon protein
MNNDSSNNGQNNSGGSDVVARLLNVLVTEVLLKVESRINEQLVSLSNRLTALEREQVEASAMMKNLDLRIDELPAYASFRDLRDKLDEIDNRLEDAENSIRDLEDDKVSSDDLEDAIRNAVEVSRSCEDPEAIVRDGLRAMLDGVKI